jgi:DNA-binding response OmpR family regulator
MNILIIEDEEKLATLLKKSLENAGYGAVYCLDAEAGESYLDSGNSEIGLVVLDFMLPGRDGIQLLKSIRERNVSIPVIMLTARDGIESRVLGLDSGADDYLIKPFSVDELLARIKALLRRPKNVLPPKLRAGVLSLDYSARKVFVNGKEVILTPKEFELLEHLMRNPNRVLNREQLLDHAWDFSFDAFSNVIDVHINHLRKKLGKGNEVVETVRGIGYRLKM